MNILCTGGAGYIGSILVSRLLAEKHNVLVLDNFMWGQVSLGHVCALGNFTLVRGDARDMRIVRPLLRQADVFIPLAALVGAPLCERSQADAISINRDAILDAVKEMSKDQICVAPISNSGYGVGDDGECDETSPLKPISLYGQTKVEAEQCIMQRELSVSLRLATVFGMSPRMRTDLLVNDFVWRASRDRSLVLFEPHFRRNFVHVRDVSSAFVHVLNNWSKTYGQIYNVGDSDANMTKLQLAETIRSKLPDLQILVAPTGQDPDKRDYLVSNKKMYGTGWRPGYTLEWGVDELLKGYQMFRGYEHGNV